MTISYHTSVPALPRQLEQKYVQEKQDASRVFKQKVIEKCIHVQVCL